MELEQRSATTERAGSICSGFGGRRDSSVRPAEAGAFGMEAVTACCVRLVGGRFISLRALFFRTATSLWHSGSEQCGISQARKMGSVLIGSYKTAWTLLHKLRRAMVRPG